MIEAISPDAISEATAEVLAYLKGGGGLPPVWYLAITIAKELQIPPWQVLGEAPEYRDWGALALAGLAARNDHIEWANKQTRRKY